MLAVLAAAANQMDQNLTRPIRTDLGNLSHAASATDTAGNGHAVSRARAARQVARLSNKLLLDIQDRKDTSAGLLVEMRLSVGSSTGLRGTAAGGDFGSVSYSEDLDSFL